MRFLPSYVESLRALRPARRRRRDARRASSPSPRATTPASTSSSAPRRRPTSRSSRRSTSTGPIRTTWACSATTTRPARTSATQRLFDRIGGVNATTQSDGFPGYGGVFAERFLGFSAHPARRAWRSCRSIHALRRHLRSVPPRHRQAGDAAEVRAGVRRAHRRLDLPGDARSRAAHLAARCSCSATWSARTLTHEVGHSLGLAEPDRRGVPRSGRRPNRLMDAGGDRPFEERAELSARARPSSATTSTSTCAPSCPAATPPPAIRLRVPTATEVSCAP